MAKSWSWSLILQGAVADQASVDIATPDYDETLTDPASIQLAVEALVVAVPGQATVTFNGATATVVNLTGSSWPPGAAVYVYAAAKGASGDTYAQVGDNTDRITALETQVADLETRVSALEAP
jgi:hypothetical protein